MTTRPICSKCGEETPSCFMQPGKTWCKSCHKIEDVDRHREINPADIPDAKVVVQLLSGKLGVECPHDKCGHKIMRSSNYFYKEKQLERCPKCMKHYFVKKGEAIDQDR